MIDRTEAERRILEGGWLSDQTTIVRDAILKVAQLVSYPAGNFVFHAGDDLGGVYGVVDGGVAVYIPTEGGETVLVHIARRGLWFGYGPYLRGRPRTLSFSINEPTTLLYVPLSDLQEIARRSPEHQKAVLSMTEYGMDVAIKALETALIRNTDRRIAATLLRAMNPTTGEEEDHSISIRLSQSQLGEMANADRQVVNRTLRELEEKGLLRTHYGRIEIVDLASLQQFANVG